MAEQSESAAPIIPTHWWRMIAIGTIAAAAIVLGHFVFQHYLRVAATILLCAIMLTYLLQPLVEWLVRKLPRCNPHAVRVAAVLGIYVLLAFGLFAMGATIKHTLEDQFIQLRQGWMNANTHVPHQGQRLRGWYRDTVPSSLQTRLDAAFKQEVELIPQKYAPKVMGWFLGLGKEFGRWIGLLLEMIFVPFVTFYLITDASGVRQHLLAFVPSKRRDAVVRYGRGMDNIMRRYIHSQLILCAIAWVVVTVALLLMHIPGALLLGLVAGVSRAIPMLGPIIGGIPVLGMIFFDPRWADAFWIALLAFSLLHVFEGKYLMPRILGEHLDLHPVVIILSLLIGAEMMGLLGMFMAPPIVAMLRFVLAVRRGEIALPEKPAEMPSAISVQKSTPA